MAIALTTVGQAHLPTLELDGRIISLVKECCLPGKATPLPIPKARFRIACDEKYDLQLDRDFRMPDYKKLRKFLPSLQGITKKMYVQSPKAFSFACLPLRLVSRPHFVHLTTFKGAADDSNASIENDNRYVNHGWVYMAYSPCYSSIIALCRAGGGCGRLATAPALCKQAY